jgi:hypothetical protein
MSLFIVVSGVRLVRELNWRQLDNHMGPFLAVSSYLFVRSNEMAAHDCCQFCRGSGVWEIGAEFDKLNQAQQHDLLRHSWVGSRLKDYFPDELETAQVAEAHGTA